MAQIGPRIGDAATRSMTIQAWQLTTFLLNAALFVLIGLEAQSAAWNLQTIDLARALLLVVLVWVVILVVRFGFLVVSAYTIRLLDRRPEQRARRVTNRARVVSTVAGFRGAVSLAAAIAVPQTLSNGDPFPGRDVIIFVTAGVVALTLVVQGILLPVAVRWARFPDDLEPAREEQLAARTSTQAALDALDETVQQLGSSPPVVDRVRSELEEHLRFVNAHEEDTEDDEEALRDEREYAELRLALVQRKRESIVRLRDDGRIDDDVLRTLQTKLDVEEVRLSHHGSEEQ